MEQFYEKMGGTFIALFSTTSALLSGENEELIIAMSPDEAAPILADFAGKLNMEMSGKFWAPSTYLPSLLKSPTPLLCYVPLPILPCHFFGSRINPSPSIGRSLIVDGARGIGNAEEVMGKEWASQPGPLELPW